jgi:hypothetical protein
MVFGNTSGSIKVVHRHDASQLAAKKPADLPVTRPTKFELVILPLTVACRDFGPERDLVALPEKGLSVVIPRQVFVAAASVNESRLDRLPANWLRIRF